MSTEDDDAHNRLLGTWNHRLVRYKGHGNVNYFFIDEVFYDAGGAPRLHTNMGKSVGGEDMKEIDWTLRAMRRALKKPILDNENWPKEWKPRTKRKTSGKAK